MSSIEQITATRAKFEFNAVKDALYVNVLQLPNARLVASDRAMASIVSEMSPGPSN